MMTFGTKARFPILLSLLVLAAPGRLSRAVRADPPAKKLDAPALALAIDRLIQARLDRAKVKASGPADDAEFLRRACLDLHGVIPPPEKVVAFLDSKDAGKRARLIDD